MNMTPDEYKKKCEWLADFYKEAAKQYNVIQARTAIGWEDFDNRGPCLLSSQDEWRIKRKKSKAWLVWERTRLHWFFHKEEADEFIKTHPGLTIQEITRPEPQ